MFTFLQISIQFSYFLIYFNFIIPIIISNHVTTSVCNTKFRCRTLLFLYRITKFTIFTNICQISHFFLVMVSQKLFIPRLIAKIHNFFMCNWWNSQFYFAGSWHNLQFYFATIDEICRIFHKPFHKIYAIGLCMEIIDFFHDRLRKCTIFCVWLTGNWHFAEFGIK